MSLEEVKNDTGHIKHLCPVDAEGFSILTIVEHNGGFFAAVYKDADARRLVACWNACDGVSTEHLENDARLIAAAPVLLAFAQEWLERQGTDENYMTAKARAAIAKAIG